MAGHQVDASCYRKIMSSTAMSAKDRAPLRAFMTHAVWSPQRLYDVGYDVDITCRLCGADSDSLGHRLFQCPCTLELRSEYLSPEDVDFTRYHPEICAIGLGVQIMPPPISRRPSGFGHESWESWTLTGARPRTYW